MTRELLLESVDALDARQFEIAVKRLADSLNYGTDKSPFVGSGIEFVQSRQYEVGDPVKAIDWKVTARTGKYHIKEYQTPKSLPVWLVIDTSASMTISSVKRSKYAMAVHLAGGIAQAALERVSPVGVMGGGGHEFRVEPSLSRERILQWMHELRRYRVDERTTVGRKLAELGASLKSRAVVLVLSDMHDPQAMRALKRMAHHHDCAVLHLVDPAERGFRGAGFLRAREAETGHECVTHSRRHWVDPQELAAGCKRAGIDRLELRTDQAFIHKLRYFFKARDLLGKGAR